MSYKYHGNFLLLNNKHRKLFVIKQSEWCRFMPKMHQNALSQDPYPQWGLLVRGRREGRGPTPKAKRGSNFPASTVKVGRNKHCQAGNTLNAKLEIPAVGIVRFVLATYSFSVTCNLLPADLT